MRPSNSSIFSSNFLDTRGAKRSPRAVYRQNVLAVFIWSAAALVILDAALGFAFKFPDDPKQRPSKLQTYFNYGRSLEGKLRLLISGRPEDDAAIVKVGWIGQECDVDSTVPAGKTGIDIYGNSFSNRLAGQMERLRPDLSFHTFAGPGAPANHSYACFVRRDESRRIRASIQIFGVLASTLPRLMTLGGLTTSFEAPQPFTYPRYDLVGQKLVATWPSIKSHEDLRAAFSSQPKWRAFLEDLAAHDSFYDEALFRRGPADYSVVARLLRRAWAQYQSRIRNNALEASNDFAGAPEIPIVLRAILLDFAERSRASGARPIIILFEDRGFGGVFDSSIAPALAKANIEFINTSKIASPTDSGNFVADGHFTSSVESKIAAAVLELLSKPPNARPLN